MRVRLTARARGDRIVIFDFLRQHSASGATNVMASIQKTLDLIGNHPGSGRETDRRGIRDVAVG